MKVRKLDKHEHQNTRALWELVFTEDTNFFLDYYYAEKANRNVIHVMEEETKIFGMLQLNPYPVRMGNTEFTGHYIIAVATHPNYRKQGIMRKLLNHALQSMYENGEAFTFLMPAAEAIYLPFDFRYAYQQRNGKAQAIIPSTSEIVTRNANTKDCRMLAEFANDYLSAKDIYIKRTAQYYELLIKELQSEGGNIAIVEETGVLIGFYLYTNAKEYIIREPLFLSSKEKYLAESLGELTGNKTDKLKCIAYNGMMEEVKEKPIIMFRILHPEKILTTVKAKKDIQVCIEIQDDIIKENNRKWYLSARAGEYLSVSETMKTAKVKITIAKLVEILFAKTTSANVLDIEPINKIFINEVV